MAFCPNCSQMIAANALSCSKCGADFAGRDSWKPVAPIRRALVRPLTTEDKASGLMIVLSFIIWLPLYLFVIKPALVPYLPDSIRSYPAKLDLIPIFVVPIAVGFVSKWLVRARINERAL
jgi:zinc ribbon protein